MKVATAEELIADQEAHADPHIHLPSPSYWPIVLAFGMPWVAYGLIYNLWFAVLGGILIVAGIWGWVLEPSTEPGGDHDHHDPGHPAPADASGETAATEEAALVD